MSWSRKGLTNENIPFIVKYIQRYEQRKSVDEFLKHLKSLNCPKINKIIEFFFIEIFKYNSQMVLPWCIRVCGQFVRL